MSTMKGAKFKMYLMVEIDYNPGLSLHRGGYHRAIEREGAPRPLQPTRITSLTSITAFVSLHSTDVSELGAICIGSLCTGGR